MSASGRVTTVRPQNDRCAAVIIDVPDALARTHTRLGQVLVFGGKTYLALTSQPGEGPFEVLASQDALAAAGLQVGTEVQVPAPVGRGFPLERAEGRDVLLFAVGTAMGPIRSLVEAIRRRRAEYGYVRLFAGAREGQPLPYADQLDAWSRDRIDVTLSASKPWVQHRFEADPPDLRNAVAFVAGMDAMVTDVKAALARAGVSDDRVLMNW